MSASTGENIRATVVITATATTTATTRAASARDSGLPVREDVRQHRQGEEVRHEAPDGEPGGESRPSSPGAAAVRGVQASQQVGADQRGHQHQPADRVARLAPDDERADDRPHRAEACTRRGCGPGLSADPDQLEADQGHGAAARGREPPRVARQRDQVPVRRPPAQRSSCPTAVSRKRGSVSLVPGTSGAATFGRHRRPTRPKDGS